MQMLQSDWLSYSCTISHYSSPLHFLLSSLVKTDHVVRSRVGTISVKMASVCVIFWAFLFLASSSFLYFGGVFNKTNIPLALVGYEMIKANSVLRASLAIYRIGSLSKRVFETRTATGSELLHFYLGPTNTHLHC